VDNDAATVVAVPAVLSSDPDYLRSAVDRDRLARDEPCSVRREEADHLCNLFGLGWTPYRDQRNFVAKDVLLLVHHASHDRPGATLFTRTPFAAYSIARFFEMLMRAPFAAQYEYE
jgi:hypothetical protein